MRALDDGADDEDIETRNTSPAAASRGWGFSHHFISKGSIYSRTILGLGVHDLTSGYKAFSRRALEAIDLSSIHSNGYSFQIETTYRAILKGMRVTEVPIIFVDRVVGKSK